VGLALAWEQLRRTATATQKVADTIEETRKQLAENHLLLVIPELERVHEEFRAHVDSNDHEAARSSLKEWRKRALEVKTYVSAQEDRDHVVTAITGAVAQIRTADENLRDEKPALEATHVLRQHMEAACDAAIHIVNTRKISLLGRKAPA